MPEISPREELIAFLKEPKRNEREIKGKLLNAAETVTNVAERWGRKKDILQVMADVRKERMERQQLEKEVIAQFQEFWQALQKKKDEMNRRFSAVGNDVRLHPDLEIFRNSPHFQAELAKQIELRGWELYVSEIDPVQMDAAIDQGITQTPVFEDDGSATQQMRKDFHAEDVQTILSAIYPHQREVVFQLDNFPPNEEKQTGRVNFFSPESGSVLDDGRWNHATAAGIDFDRAGNVQKVEMDLDNAAGYERRSTLRSVGPEIHMVREGESYRIQYLNVRPLNKHKTEALRVILDKLQWMAYAINNVGGEYFARANADYSLPAADGGRRTQTAASLFIQADPEKLRQKVDKLTPLKEDDLESNNRFPFSF